MKEEHDWERFYDLFINQWVDLTAEEEKRFRLELEPSNLAPAMYWTTGFTWMVLCYFMSTELDIAWYFGIPLAFIGAPVVAIFVPYLLVTLPLTTLWYEPKLKEYERFRDKVQNAIDISYQDCLTEYGKEVRKRQNL